MIADTLWWPGTRKKMSDNIKSCDGCKLSKPIPPYRGGVRMPVTGLFHASLNHFTYPLPFTYTWKKFLIVAMENITSWPVARVSTSADSDVVVTFHKKY